MIYTVKETAKILKLNPETVKRMIYREELKAVKVGKSWRIDETEINRILGR